MKSTKALLLVSCLLVIGLTGCPVDDQQTESTQPATDLNTQSATAPDKPAEPAATVDTKDVSELTLEEMLLEIKAGGHQSILAMFEFSEAGKQESEDGWIKYAFVWKLSPIPAQFSYNEKLERFTFIFPADYLATQRKYTVSELIADYDELVDKYGCDSGDEDGTLTRNLNFDGINVFLQQLGSDNKHYTKETYPAIMHIGSPKED